jgi:predicted dienelactone hydrolase
MLIAPVSYPAPNRRLSLAALLRSALLAFGCALVVSCCSLAQPDSSLRIDPDFARRANVGPESVRIVDVLWRDAKRRRTIRARIYMPASPGPHPVIVFTHGLGNNRFGYEYLGRFWASHGYISVHPQHPNLALIGRSGLYRYFAGWDHRYWRLIPADIRFVLDALERGDDLPEPVRAALDLTRVAVAGHSLGAYAALAEAGLEQRDGGTLRDPRVVAAIPMSMSENFPPSAYGTISIPVLNFTGTCDSDLLYGYTAAKRRVPFDSTTRDDQYLVTLTGATHSIFSDEETQDNRAAHDVIRAATLAFLDAYVRKDPAAKIWLREKLGADVASVAAVEER